MEMFSLLPLIILPIYLGIIFGIIYLIYRWVSKIIFLKQEHNDLLREIIKKMDK